MEILLKKVYVQPISNVVAEMMALVILWTILGWFAKCRSHWKWFNGLVFLGSVVAILYATVFNRGERFDNPVWIPFYTFVAAKIQPELYRMMLMNIFLFEPFGLALPNILPRKLHPVAVTILFAMLCSLGIELTQLFFHLGKYEADDVIMNTLGAAIGAAAYWLTQFLRSKQMMIHR